jgi:peptidoglycan hydrolase-like protein with peptidoglycan-binding domain
MNTIMNPQSVPRNVLLTVGTLAAMSLILMLGIQSASAAITVSLDFGDTGSQVTELQTYLATNSTIYPSGLVTGYFGPLTQAAVQRFQNAQGIVSSGNPESTGYGRVGPLTMARINALLGGGSPITWDATPVLTNPTVQVTNTTVTIAWISNEQTQGQVYWSASPLVFYEANGPRQQPYVSGTLALDAGGSQTNHTVTVSNLQANTVYYYLVRGVDNGGNMSMIWPSTFRTNP